MSTSNLYRLTFVLPDAGWERTVTYAAADDAKADMMGASWAASWGARTWQVRRLRPLGIQLNLRFTEAA